MLLALAGTLISAPVALADPPVVDPPPTVLPPEPQLTPTAPVGTLPGSFEVTDTGSAHYAIPLELPPAPGGHAPNLSLVYDSASGDGLLGVGWGLAGQSAISRCGPSLALDGELAPLTFTDDDQLCLDGQRLVLASGQHLAVGAEYRTRDDSFAQVRLLTPSECPAGMAFEVRRADGLIDRYGCSDDGQVRSHVGTQSWALSSRRDRFGNTIRYAYAFETLPTPEGFSRVDHRLARVEYGTRQVELEYEARPDDVTGFVRSTASELGIPTARAHRLTEVRTLVDDDLVRRWPLTYANDSITARSRITAIRECAADGVCRPATRFEYSLGELAADNEVEDTWSFDGVAFPHTYSQWHHDPYASAQVVLDGDGDGLTDILVASGNSGVPAPISRGWEFWQMQPEATAVNGNICGHNYGDVDPEDCPEGMYSLPEGLRSEVLSASDPQSIGVDQPMFAFDYDGDGRDDAIAATQTGSPGYPYGFAVWGFLITSPTKDGFGDVSLDISGPDTPAWIYAAADFTGDGLGDLLYCQGEPEDLEGWTGTWRLLPNTPGLGFEPEAAFDTQLHCSALDKLVLTDHDGDGVASPLVITGKAPGADSWLPVEQWADYRALVFDAGLTEASWAETGLPPDVVQRWRWAPTPILNVPKEYPWHGPTVGVDKIVDVQGDGLPDILRYELQTGDGVEDSLDIATSVLTADPPQPELGGVRLWLNVGGRFVDGGWVALADEPGGMLFREFTSASPLDWNADGAIDLLVPSAETQSWTAWLSQRDGSFAVEPLPDGPTWWTQVSINARSLAAMDVDGDGLHDPVFWSFALNGHWDIWRHRGEVPDRITAITDGMGQRVEIDYASLTDYEKPRLEAFDLDACSWPQDCARSPQVVVERHRIDTGLGSTQAPIFREYTHRYEGRRNDRLERRGLGFRRHETTEWVDGVAVAQRTRSFWNHLYDEDLAASPFAGRLASETEQRRDPETGRVWASRTARTFEAEPTVPGAYHVVSNLSVSKVWTLPGCFADFSLGFCSSEELTDEHLLSQTTHSVFSRDALLMPLQERATTGIANGPDVVTTARRQIEHDLDTWLLGQIVRETITSVGGPGGPDSVARTTAYAYDPDTGALASETREPEHPLLYLNTAYLRDAFGNVEKVTHTDFFLHSRELTIAYGPDGVFPIKVSNALGHSRSMQWHPGLGVLVDATTMAGLRQIVDIDGLGRTTGVRVYAANINKARGDDTTLSYLPSSGGGLSVRVSALGHGSEVTDYDRLGRPVREAWVGPDGLQRETRTRYDSEGRVHSSTLPSFGGQVPPGQHAFSYDGAGRLSLHEFPDGSFERWYYSGLTTEHRDAAGERSVTRVDAAGRVVERTRAGGTPDAERLCFDHGPFSQVVRVRPDCIEPGEDLLLPPGEAPATVKTFEHDRLGRLIASYDAQEGHQDLAWTAFDELASVVDGNGLLTEFGYDELGRLDARMDSDGLSTWTYDEQTPGLLSASLSATGVSKAISYDAFARPISVVNTIHGEDFVTRMAYDDRDRLARVHYPAAPHVAPIGVSHTYSDEGALLEVRDQSGEALWTAEAFDEHGNLTRERFANGLVTERGWDPLTGKLRRIQTLDPELGPADPLQDLRYDWNPVGTLAAREDVRGGQREDFGYDHLHRLAITRALKGAKVHERHFAYDSLSNLAYATDVGEYEYDGLGRLTLAGGVGHVWDDAGLLLERTDAEGTASFEYTAFDKPWLITRGAHELEFDYDADEGRVWRYDSAKEQETVYVGGLYERDTRPAEGGEELEHRYYLYAADRVIGELRFTVGSDLIVEQQQRTIHDDHLGSVDLVTDEAGHAAQRRSHDAWGKLRDPDDWTTPDEFLEPGEVNRGFTGHEGQLDFGLVNMKGRLYDPKLGRMASADPFVPAPGVTAGWNRFAYVVNNPVSLTDPSGFSPAPSSEPASPASDAPTSADSTSPTMEGANKSGSTFVIREVAPNEFESHTDLGESEAGSPTDHGPDSPEAETADQNSGNAESEAEARGPAGEASGAPGMAESTGSDIGLGVFDGLTNLAYSNDHLGMAVAAVRTASTGDLGALTNRAAYERGRVGGLLGSEAIARQPDSIPYHATMLLTEMAATAGVGAVEGLASGGRSLLQRALSQNGGGIRDALMEALPEFGCFLEGTPVLTPDGPVPIDELRAGDTVLAADLDERGNVLGFTQQIITGTSERQVDELLRLTLDADGERLTLTTTPDHPFYVPELDAYVRGEHLGEGTQLLTLGGEPVKLIGKASLPGPAAVFNLEVEGTHNYFAMVDGVAFLVHNGGCSRRLGKNLIAAGFTRPHGHAAHHIVAKAAKSAKEARLRLERLGIDIDDAVNGVFLPQTKAAKATSQAAYHPKLHTEKYYMAVTKRLRRAKTSEQATKILNRIADDLSKGVFPF
ncbi:Rhs family protein-like protein [Plesiocystis pacifica SIR-1]|uniref:Rhs family protein-like protein n=1 Tax=Plesiocystis pacifica SIR-1 TaxID=391625 RepID=A6G3J9_9BACT|nr:AHH domain-containing protein [Plesiocystis pacifica]EDM79606.1 Rhs family protein-like protein [Plesiocystis pacifica SIR-1]